MTRASQFEYKVTQPLPPPGANSPVMDYEQMTWWVNDMASRGWDFVGYGEKHWANDPMPQSWWVFRRLRGGA